MEKMLQKNYNILKEPTKLWIESIPDIKNKI